MKFDFNALSLETLDANVNLYPDIYVNATGVTFSKKVVEDLGYPAYVLCQLDAKNRVFVVKTCKSNEPKGFRFSKPKAEQKGTVCISNKNLLEPLRSAMADIWQTGKRYRATGFWVADAKAMCFELSEATQEVFRESGDAKSSPVCN